MMKSLIADTVIYLIQVQGDKNGSVGGESLCYTHRYETVMFKRDNGLQHSLSVLETAALTRDSTDLLQKCENFRDCVSSTPPSLIHCINECREHRAVQ